MPKTFLRNLQIGMGVSVILVLASSIASYISIKNQIADRANVEHSRKVIESANKILHDLQNAETGQRGYHLTGREAFLQPYKAALTNIPQSLERTITLVADNPQQLKNAQHITALADMRMSILTELVSIKRNGGDVTLDQLDNGRRHMDSCRTSINHFIDTEVLLLEHRSSQLDRSTDSTVFFIPLAAILSLLITIVCFLKIRQDYTKKEQLQNALRKKDQQITERLHVIQRIAAQIAKGDYSVKVNDTERDDLGSLAGSLNAMANSLNDSFVLLRNNEWQQRGIAALNEKLVGNRSETDLLKDALTHLIEYTEGTNGACYMWEDGNLWLKSAWAMEDTIPSCLAPGQGMIGQVFDDKKIRQLHDLQDEDYIVSCASGKIRVKEILLMPIMADESCIGVIEIGARVKHDDTKVKFFKEAVRNIGIAAVAARGRAKVQSLLEETQAQTEELQVQHAELENLNTELEAQAQRLQTSEEELRVQQEELLNSNAELEAHADLLEDRNQLISQRNVEIQQKAEALALSTKYKSEFLANMSHELRTPLNSILLLSRLLADNTEGNLQEEQIQSANVIQSAGTSLLLLIDEILDLSKIESGNMQIHIEKVDMQELMQGLRSLFEPVAAQKGLSLKLNGLDTVLDTDRLRLEQVLRNLLSNALKFTNEGEVSLTIKEGNKDADCWRFEVKDTGVGIPEDKLQVIFEAFQQADGSTRRKYGGTGLGLSISREIARLLGGYIEVTSELGQGSVFELVLPKHLKEIAQTTDELKEASTPTHDQKKDRSKETEDAALPQYVPNALPDDRGNIRHGDKVILIVEDDTDFANQLLKYANQQGYKGVVIVRGDKAVEATLKYKPVAILLDIMLPMIGGWDIMEDLKNNPDTRHIPVHMMSSMHARKRGLSMGAIDFLSKPISLQQIAEMFRKIENALSTGARKVLIVEENAKHAEALSFFLSNFNIATKVQSSMEESIKALQQNEADCVILDMGVPYQAGYEMLEAIKKNEALENVPIIVFTGENVSEIEHVRLKEYADSIVIKTAHSYQRILDEVGLFLHVVEKKVDDKKISIDKSLGKLQEILEGKKVLVVDDDVRNIFSLSKVLERHHMQILSATNGKEALEQLEMHPDIAVVLMDIMMPEMDGYETIVRIREKPDYKKLPIIAVTAKAMLGDRDKCMQVGASDYISKPVDTHQLLSLLKVWLYEI